MKAKTRVIRVGTSTNYGFTDSEREALEQQTRPTDLPFLNTNGETPLQDHGLPVIVTLNPHLTRFRPPKGTDAALARIAACRVKWVAGAKPAVQRAYSAAVRWARKRNLPVLITRMRWFRQDARAKYVTDTTPYLWCGGQYKPVTRPEQGPGMYLCDSAGGGCPACRLCSVLTYGNTLVPHGLNLSASLPAKPSRKGFVHCKHDCPQCWAARALQRAGTGGRPKCDIVYRNQKQNGALHRACKRRKCTVCGRQKSTNDLRNPYVCTSCS